MVVPRNAKPSYARVRTLLITAAPGVGDILRVTPLIRICSELGYQVDVLIFWTRSHGRALHTSVVHTHIAEPLSTRPVGARMHGFNSAGASLRHRSYAINVRE